MSDIRLVNVIPVVNGWKTASLKNKGEAKNEFCRLDFQSMGGTNICGNAKCENYMPSYSWMQPPECAIEGCYLKRPPQSWCYVAENEENL